MRAIVTGGLGFIGHNLVKELLKREWDVIVIDDRSCVHDKDLGNRIFKNVKYLYQDISEPLNMDNEAFIDTDYVFHLAAKARVQPSIKEPDVWNKTNVTGTLNVLMMALKYGVKKVIFSSSSSVYGDISNNLYLGYLSENTSFCETFKEFPQSPYALQKLIGEQYMKLFSELYGLKTVSLRYFNVYGEGMSNNGQYRLMLPIFMEATRQGKPLSIFNKGEHRRDYTSVSDVVEANMLAAESNVQNGEAINIGTGKNYSVNEIADIFGGEKEYLGNTIEPKYTLADNLLAKELLGWEPKGNLEQWILENKDKWQK